MTSHSTPVIITLFEKIGPWLTSLDGLYPPQADLHEYLRSLEQVIFCDLPSWSYTFPPSVRRVGYHHRAGTEWAPDGSRMLCFLAALEALPYLQLVTATRTSREDILIALETTCRLRSVEFIIYTDAESFPVRPSDSQHLLADCLKEGTKC
ncbi:hypothetical protein BV25DRAFT_456204 [Artomyces pyxidatus]|uniref:Uncharacterized protein n=1 Tax=Artomyces pyxidatus TaxID=48021 RepID=A0ACB8T372_9AGAM|nr:hypothetical protein BV25DRAFT_456204 [Artomyces pyxidatus]